jgi:hypothetical protein
VRCNVWCRHGSVRRGHAEQWPGRPSHRLFEQLDVEQYFKNQTGPYFHSYWIGLRQPGLGNNTW